MHYRAYLLDDIGKIFNGEDIEASDDADAIVIGQNILEIYNKYHSTRASGFEIWLGRDLVFHQML